MTVIQKSLREKPSHKDYEMAKEIIREAEIAVSRLLKTPVTLDMNFNLTKSLEETMIRRIIKVVFRCENQDLNKAHLKTRKREIVEARYIAIHIAKQVYNLGTLKFIGLNFGGRDHSTILHGIEFVEDQIKLDADFRARYELALSSVKLSIGEPS